MKPRFLLDEHINHSIQRQLRRIDPHDEYVDRAIFIPL